MENIRIISKETMNNFTPFLKDYLCRLYNFIDRNLKGNDVEEPFTELKVHQAIRAISIAGTSSSDVRFAKIFIANLELIKELIENQPTKTIEYGYYGIIGDSKEEVYCKREELTFTSYNIDEMERDIKNKGKNYIIKTISTKNLELIN